MKIEAEPRRYQGFMANEMAAQMKKPFCTVKYLGNKAAMSFLAGSEFSKIEEKIAEEEKQAAIKKHPALFPAV